MRWAWWALLERFFGIFFPDGRSHVMWLLWSMLQKKYKKLCNDPYGTRTRSLLLRRETRYHYANGPDVTLITLANMSSLIFLNSGEISSWLPVSDFLSTNAIIKKYLNELRSHRYNMMLPDHFGQFPSFLMIELCSNHQCSLSFQSYKNTFST